MPTPIAVMRVVDSMRPANPATHFYPVWLCPRKSLPDFNFRHTFKIAICQVLSYEKHCQLWLRLFFWYVFADTTNIPCDVLVSLSATFRLAVRLYSIAPFFLSRQEDPPRLNGLDIEASIQTYGGHPCTFSRYFYLAN